MYKYIVLVIFLFYITATAIGQPAPDYPIIGKACPNIIFQEIHHFRLTKGSLSDFKGKPLIIDFFEQYCVACFSSFPKINQLQKNYKNQLQFLLFGYDKKFSADNKRGVRQDYQRFQEYYQLDLPVAYDSVTPERFKLMSFPYVVWIDEKGIVQAGTRSDELTNENIEKFLHHDSLNLPLALNTEQGDNELFYDFTKPLLMNGNGGNDTDFVYRSVLMNWKYRQGFMYYPNLCRINIKNIQGVGLDVFNLYKEAFGDTAVMDWPPNIQGYDAGPNHYGLWYLKPVLELRDSTLFQPDFSSGKNVYSYNLSIPSASSLLEMQVKMQLDLKNYFGFDVTVENRQVPCWRLVANDSAKIKLRTKGGKEMSLYSQSGFTFINQPVSAVIWVIFSRFGHEVIIDETGITSPIDIDINAVLSDLNDLQRALRAQGLDLVRGTKEMKTIVFREPKKE